MRFFSPSGSGVGDFWTGSGVGDFWTGSGSGVGDLWTGSGDGVFSSKVFEDILIFILFKFTCF